MRGAMMRLLAMFALLTLLMLGGVWLAATQPQSVGAVASVLANPVTDLTGGPTNTTVSAATAADAENVELVGHIGGATYAVFVQGSYAYIGEGPSLTILDVSDPASPTVSGKTSPLPGIVQDIYVSAGYAYIADGNGSLRVVNVSNPAAPAEDGFYPFPGSSQGVAASGYYVYLADGDSGLWVVDVSTPSSPKPDGRYITPGHAWDVAVAGNYAYIAEGSEGLRIVDVSTPTLPVAVGSYNTPGDAQGVTVVGSYAYVADGYEGLRIVDVTNPMKPEEVGSCDTPQYAYGVAVAGTYAYVADWLGGLRIMDVFTPTNPMCELGVYDTPESAHGVAVAEGYAYIADEDSLLVVDVSDPEAPTEVGSYDAPLSAGNVTVAGSYAYVADFYGGLEVVDVSTPMAPTWVSSYDAGGIGMSVAVTGDFAYLANYADLRVVRVFDPRNPIEWGWSSTPEWVYDVVVSSTYAYVAGWDVGPAVLDVTYPTTPEEVGSCDTPGEANGVTVSGTYAYVADGDAGLRIMDVFTPTNPACEVGFYDTPEYALGVAVAEGYAYVADSYSGLRVVDVSAPISPTEVSFYDTPGNARGVVVTDGYAYVADEDSLRVADVSVPLSPTEVGFYDTPGSATGVTAVGSYVYVADGEGGLFILYFTWEGSDPPTDASISGPTMGSVNTPHTFTAIVNPITAMRPITYVWQATGQPPIMHTDRGRSDTVGFTWSTAGTRAITVTATNVGGTVSASHTITITESPTGGDTHEPDGTCTQASSIPSDGIVQVHTFHQHADADWVTFDAISGTTYLIEAQVPADSPADVLLELYDQCDGSLQDSQDYDFSPGVRLAFQAPASGPLYLKLSNHDPSVYGSKVTYHLSVRALDDTPIPGALVLVAGRLKMNDPLQDNIHHVTDTVYQLFLAHGYDDSRIHYLATDISLNGVDALATAANLEAAITTWAQDKVSPDRPLTLYLMDHGGYDKLYLDKPAGEWVTPQEVNDRLTQLEAAVPGAKVNVIVEACRSGSFIDLPQTVSASGRVVIASTGAYALAYASNAGAVFSDHFIAALREGESLYNSFQSARWATQAAHPDQTPWLDDDGDGSPNEGDDGQDAARRGFAFAGTLPEEAWPPYVVQATGPTEIEEGQGVIRAEVQDDERVKRVWAVIYPPSYQPSETEEEMVQEVLPTIVLLGQGNDWYGATYTGFDETGVYRVVVYAEDDNGREARPLAIEVRTGWPVYLPLVLRNPQVDQAGAVGRKGARE